MNTASHKTMGNPFFGVKNPTKTELTRVLGNEFRKGNIVVSDILLHEIYVTMNFTIEHILVLCRLLFYIYSSQTDETLLDRRHIEEAIDVHIAQNEIPYQLLRHQLTQNQIKCAKVISKNDGLHLYTKRAMAETEVSNQGAMRRLIKGLELKAIIYKKNKGYRFSDPFFERWIINT